MLYRISNTHFLENQQYRWIFRKKREFTWGFDNVNYTKPHLIFFRPRINLKKYIKKRILPPKEDLATLGYHSVHIYGVNEG